MHAGGTTQLYTGGMPAKGQDPKARRDLKTMFGKGDLPGHPADYGPVHPFGPGDEPGSISDYPLRHRELGGDSCQWPGKPVYNVREAIMGRNPMVGHPYKWEFDVGAVFKPKLNADYTMNQQDRWVTMSYADWGRIAFYNFWSGRVWWATFYGIFFCLWAVCQYDTRKEPIEKQIDRDEFFKRVDLWLYGHDFDHHGFHHMLAIRRANKWGYYDVTLGPHGQVHAPEHLKEEHGDHH